MKGRIFFGIIVVVVGVILLLTELELVAMDGIREIFQWLPSLFILWGLVLLVTRKFKRAGGPITLIAFAAVVQLLVLDMLNWVLLLAIAVILIGVAIIAGGMKARGRRKRRREHRLHREQRIASSSTHASGEDYLNISVKMGEVDERNRSQEFQGGEISCVMGTIKLNLAEAEVADPPARIHVDVVMGNLEVLVPDHWIVQNDVDMTMGEVEDRTESRRSAATDDGFTLIFSGSTVMGHVTITSADEAEAD